MSITFRINPNWEREARDEFDLDPLGQSMKAHARRIVPIDTGRLHDSIDYFYDRSEGTGVLYLYADTSYAAYVELGTRFTPAQPYLRPAVERRHAL